MRQVILCGASALAISLSMTSNAQAQESAEDTVEAVVVTGSRIARSDYVAESPILTLGADAIVARGPTTLDQVFNNTPQFTASNQSSANNPSRAGRMNANLRGLGIQRTLVLVDGRRVQPSDASGAVDLNSIAPALVENIEIITGGASAAYGSDAIAGVVNFKLKRNFQGVEVDAQYGETARGDGASKDISLTMGSNFADDRGNFIASLTYLDRELIRRGSREFFARSGIGSALYTGVVRVSAANAPSQAATNAVWGAYGGAIPARTAGFSFNRDGTLFTQNSPIINYRGADMDPWILAAGIVGYTLGRSYPIQTPITRYQGFFRARYNLTETLEAYAQFNHMEYKTGYIRAGWAAGQTAPSLSVPVTNPYVTGDLATLMASRPNPFATIDLTSTTEKVGDSRYTYDYDLNEYMVGLRGAVPWKDITWDAYASYGTTAAKERIQGFMSVTAWNTLVNAPDAGASICGPGGFDPFSYNSLQSQLPAKQACYDFLERSINETTDLDQVNAEVSLQGALFDLPAGESRFAGGVSYRRQSFDFQPDGQRVRNEVWPVQQTAPTQGSYNVSEAFVEVYAPLLKDLPLIQSLSTSLAYRYSDYNLFGGVNTYKASLDWQVIDSVRVRGGYQRAIRAPSLQELYAPALRGSKSVGTPAQGAGDPCSSNGPYRNGPDGPAVTALCIAQGVPASIINGPGANFIFNGASVSGVSTGSTALREEVADTYTLGIVWQSKFDHPLLSSLSASLDYYEITVEDAIGQITSALGLNRCFSKASNPTFSINNVFCQLTTRSPDDGFITTQLEPTLNLASYKAAGYDLQADWRFNLEDIGLGDRGRLGFNLVVSYLDTYEVQAVTGQPFVDYNGSIGFQGIDSGAYGVPQWKINGSVTYSVGFLDVSARWRWIDSMDHNLTRGDGVARAGVEHREYLDLDAKFRLDEMTETRLGVINVFDTEPAVWTGDGATDLANYDLIGRRWFIGINRKF